MLRPAEARQLRWCDVRNVDGSLSTRYEKVCGMVHIRETKTRRRTGHATQQHELLECSEICQLFNTMKSSLPVHNLDTPIGRFAVAQHFAYFQRQLRSLGVSHQHHTLHGLGGGGATDHGLRRGRWTSEREGYSQDGTFQLHQNPALQRSCRPSQCFSRARGSFLCRTRLRRVPPPPLTTTTLPPKG